MAAKIHKHFTENYGHTYLLFVLWRYTLWPFEPLNTQKEYSMSANIFSQSLGAKL